MDYQKLIQKRDIYQQGKNRIPELTISSYEQAFEIEYTYHFADGNGRTSRLLMNYQLMSNGFAPIAIAKENCLTYFEALETYAVNKNLQPFADMIAELEEKQLDRYISMIG